MDKRMIGIAGEKLTCKWYSDNGYTLIAVNYHSRYGEIDLIVKKGNMVVFSEVKTRNEKSFYSPKEAVTLSKQNKIKLTASLFIDENNLTDNEFRFDVAEVYYIDNSLSVNVIENAFE